MCTEEQILNTVRQINLKFSVLLGKSLSQTLEMLQKMYEDHTMSHT